MSKRRTRPTTPDRQVREFSVGGLELRNESASSETVTLRGHASVYDYEYNVAGGLPYGWIESVEPGAFDETLSENPDVVLLLNHTGLPIARTKSGTLRLSSDDVGLLMEADLDVSDPDVAALLPKIERGDVDEMSFAFRVTDQSWSVHDDAPDDEYAHRRINAVNLNRGDVSVVTYGASDATDVSLRSLIESADVATLEEMRTVLDRRLSNEEEDESGGTPDESPVGGMSAGVLVSIRNQTDVNPKWLDRIPMLEMKK